MKFSVITVCFNSELTIESTIRSVLEQDHTDVEYIIIDGLSTDSTPQIVRSFSSSISQFISEKDEGMYDAINKGISLATGEVIAILNADDFYCSKGVLSKVAKEFAARNTDSVYGDLDYVDFKNTAKVKRRWRSGVYSHGKFLNGWMPPHPAFFLRKSCYRKYGAYNTSFKTAADYELMLRMLHKNKISTSCIHEVLVKMRTGGMSNTSVKNRVNANLEDRKAWEINGLKPRWYTLTLKPLRKLGQFF